MSKGWRERRVYQRSLGRAVAPRHRVASLKRQHRRRDTGSWIVKKQHYNLLFNKPPKEEQMYNIDVLEYLRRRWLVPKDVSSNWNIPVYRGTLNKPFFWKREVDEYGRQYKEAVQDYYNQLDRVGGGSLSQSEVDAVMNQMMRETIREAGQKNKRESMWGADVWWREKPKSTTDAAEARAAQNAQAPYTKKEYREESEELKRQRTKKSTPPKTKKVKKVNPSKTIGGKHWAELELKY